MANILSDEAQAALRPLASLIGKSEKAQQKLAPGTWQHTMLRDNLRALRLATALLTNDAAATASCTRNEWQDALRACASMISRTESAMPKFAPGTPQHTLQRNRLAALRLAEARIKAEVDNG